MTESCIEGLSHLVSRPDCRDLAIETDAVCADGNVVSGYSPSWWNSNTCFSLHATAVRRVHVAVSGPNTSVSRWPASSGWRNCLSSRTA